MKRVNVTQPSLPPLDEFVKYLEKIWETKWVTNQGPLHEEFESALAAYLGVEYLSLFANGTLALMAALQVSRVTGEVITTPYTFVATAHALHWNNIKPVFVDVDPWFCNIDPERIEAAITPKTTAILPVHVYGNPCDVDGIKQLADMYGLKVIYDACHGFAVKRDGVSLLEHGDLSILSFHGTKVFNTMEGGAVVCHDPATKKRIDYLKNFGFVDEVTVVQPGINAKMNEMQAALGLLQLNEVDHYIMKREKIARVYRQELEAVEGIRFLRDIENVKHNYSYFPIFVKRNEFKTSRDDLYHKLQKNGFFGRRYFYPLVTHFPIYRGMSSSAPSNLPMAEKLAGEVICLPIYPDLSIETVRNICAVIRGREE